MCTQPLVSGAEKALVIPIDVLPLKELGTFRRPHVPREANLHWKDTCARRRARKMTRSASAEPSTRRCRRKGSRVPRQDGPDPCRVYGSDLRAMRPADTARKRQAAASPLQLRPCAFAQTGWTVYKLEPVSYTHLTLPTSDLV